MQSALNSAPDGYTIAFVGPNYAINPDELLKTMAGINLVHVPYRGTAPALADLLAGQVQVVFDNIPGSIGHIKTGKVRALGVTKTARHGKSDIVSQLPNIGTVPVRGTWRAGDANAGCPSL
jgi:tripartite-type tricarboxylate transporter receptor subunit TctC